MFTVRAQRLRAGASAGEARIAAADCYAWGAVAFMLQFRRNMEVQGQVVGVSIPR